MRCAALGLLAVCALAQNALEPLEVIAVDRFTEGPVFDDAGNLYFSEPDRVIRLTPDGRSSTWLEASANGHKILPDGTHLVCSPEQHAVLHVSADGELLGPAAAECDGEPLRAPNDITLDAHGGFYFSDPGGSRERPIGSVCYVGPDGESRLSAAGMWVPNGLVLSPDRRTLYVAETVPNRILKFSVGAPGALGPIEVFAQLPERPGHDAAPDGMAVDSEGNLYVAHLGSGSVRVLSPAGELLRTLPAGVYDASNLVFGGADMNRLFVTGSVGHRSNTAGRVYRLDLDGVRGVSSSPSRR
jgi:gluconolactonase